MRNLVKCGLCNACNGAAEVHFACRIGWFASQAFPVITNAAGILFFESESGGNILNAGSRASFLRELRAVEAEALSEFAGENPASPTQRILFLERIAVALDSGNPLRYQVASVSTRPVTAVGVAPSPQFSQ